MPSSLAKRLKGGKPKRAKSPTPKTPPRAGRRASRDRTPSIWLVPSAAMISPEVRNKHALGQAVAEDVQQDGGDGERDAGGRAQGDQAHVLDAVVGEHPLVVALGEQQRRRDGEREQGHDHEQRAGELGPDAEVTDGLEAQDGVEGDGEEHP